MSDNKNDDFVEDIEFDDIEDIENFDDDLLDDDVELADDVDIEAEDFEDDEDWGDEDDQASDDISVKSKSSSSKLLLPLFALIAVGGGGYFYYTQMMNTDTGNGFATQTTQSLPQDQANNPVSPQVPENTAPIDISATDPSIPMPSPISNETDSIETIEEQPATFREINNFDISETVQPLETPDNNVLTPMPNMASDNPATFEDAAIQEPAIIEESVEEVFVADNAVTAPEMDTVHDDLELHNDQNNIISPPPTAITEPNATHAKDVNNAEMEQIQADMQALRENMQSQISDLNNALSQKDQTIDSLENQVQGMENNLAQKDKELAALKKELQVAQKASSVPAPKTQNKPKVSDKPAAPKKTASKQAEKEIMPKWELRSAQPGRAYVSIKGSNDVQVIEKGDTLHGIGKILSISNKNGLWVVQGSNSNITQ